MTAPEIGKNRSYSYLVPEPDDDDGPVTTEDRLAAIENGVEELNRKFDEALTLIKNTVEGVLPIVQAVESNPMTRMFLGGKGRD